jgi:glucose/arabinose dehydrogenase
MKVPLLAFTIFAFLFFFLSFSFAQVYPSNFSQVEVATGILNPTVMAFAPDGRIFVAQQNGVLHVIKNGVKLPTPALQLPVNTTGERGLIGIALHPAFATNKIIYLHYTLPDGTRNRISRFYMNGDVVNSASEQIIFNLDLLATSPYHNGGAMHFSGDKLYIAVGDNSTGANSQSLETTKGKLLRINANGSIPGDNPFYSLSASPYRNAIWSLGLRNPYTFDIQPGTGKIFVNDVGQVTWEEIDDATIKGKNFGWPTTEGNTTDPSFVSPLYQYPHGTGDGVGCAITGGVFFNPSSTTYPSTYIGKYFFLDYCNGWINYIDFASGAVRYSFAQNTPAQALALDMGTDGNLYFLTRAGSLFKVIYDSSSSDTEPPAITDEPNNVLAAIGQTATFTVSATGAQPLSYQWKKNGSNIAGANSATFSIATVQQSDAGNYAVTVYNNYGTVNSSNATLSINSNSLPVPTIVTPAAGTLYRGGDIIAFSGDASDPEDGTLPASAFSWSVVFHHGDHVHDGPPVATGVKSGTYTIPSSGETAVNVFYRIYLTVTDAQGLPNSTYVDVKPNLSIISLQSNPTGLNLTIDGQPFTTLTPIKSVEGIQRTIGIVTPQTLNGTTYTFASWAHGGTNSQTLFTPIDNTTYTANFSRPLDGAWNTTDIGKLNLVGSAALNNGTFTLSASGRDIYNADDHFRFVYGAISGNCDIRARVTGITNTNQWAKAGLMVRESLQPNAKNAAVLITPANVSSFQRRSAAGGSTAAVNSTGTVPYWLRLVREGNNFSAYRSPDGNVWTMIGSPAAVSMSAIVYVGLAVTSHSSNALCTATIDNVSLIGTASATALATTEITTPGESLDGLSVYPNPLDGNQLYIGIRNNAFARGRIQVINSLGQVVFEQEIESSDELHAVYEINAERISAGLYFVRFDSKEKQMSAAFVRK